MQKKKLAQQSKEEVLEIWNPSHRSWIRQQMQKLPQGSVRVI